MTPDHFRTFARYNAWANRRLYDAVESLDAGEYTKARASFFGSIHATLNHVLVGDRVWLARILGGDSGIAALDQILYDTLPDLRRAREAEDQRILTVVEDIGPDRLDRPVVYANMAGQRFETPLRWVLAHLFNHQTHHRGQVHDMLSQTAVPPPPLDLIYYLREAG